MSQHRNATVASSAAAASTTVLLTLAAGQFLMTLDSSVMNVSIATVANDLGTTVSGIQTAITLYTLVMASLMITGGKIGAILGRKRAFAIGCVVYGAGSLTTALAPNLGVLLLGWSLLEGLGAALIMPAIVALVASNFAPEARPRAYGIVAASGAIAVAVGPLIGGLLTTYASWRWVFAGEVVIVAMIVLFARRIVDTPPDKEARLDLVGTALSALGLGLVVYGILKGGTWGFVRPRPEAPSWLGMSLVVWMVVAGGIVLRVFMSWETRRLERGEQALLDPSILRIRQLRGGLVAFFFQFLLQAGLFFAVPLFLSVALGLSAIDTGLRIMPLSITLLAAALGIPRFWPKASPRLVVRIGIILLLTGIVVLAGALELGVGPEVVTGPLLLAGLGIGALASQLGAVTVSAVPDEQSPEVGGIQNTVTNLGASIGTAFIGAVLMTVLTASFFTGIKDNPAIPPSLSSQAQVQLDTGVPFIPDSQLEAALAEAGITGETATAIVDENTQARLDGLRAALIVLALIALVALFFTGSIPVRPPGRPESSSPSEAPLDRPTTDS
ncbi:MFS transporter [Intrasporangium oryzae NRRL B-24470]|uniref:MFS transporter n=1 Tax=Intrasporangium oryzae NRRL B-24470 TaxID=1386089 RepID=W9GA47_9MICO|nr:MFS transporter [Intrasporangium oryzae]EWT01708.1 MFS transporter [Intrasporangium oryzae NRRL B-24470]